LSAWYSIGPLRTILFTLLSFGVAYVAEWSSTRIGIPFGEYYYTEGTKGREIFLSNVPFMDTLSFTFLSYVSYALALFFESRRRGEGAKEGLSARTSPRVWAMATLFFVLIDVVIDPLAVRGDRWFLGRIFGYAHPGFYFGVPLSNFIGWGIVGGLTFFLIQRSDRVLVVLGASNPPFPSGDVRDVLGPALYYLVLAFNLSVTFWIGEGLLGLSGLLIYTPITFFFLRYC
jgi:uncharacterized membrane protein